MGDMDNPSARAAELVDGATTIKISRPEVEKKLKKPHKVATQPGKKTI